MMITMKKILLFSLFLFNASLVDAMANLATMLKASAALRRNLQMVDVTVEHRDDGTTFVHYGRNGDEMAVFNADLLKNSGQAWAMLEELGVKPQQEMLIDIVKQLFKDASGIEQIKLAVNALGINSDNPQTIKDFVDTIADLNDLAWLAVWSDEWEVEHVYKAIITRIAIDKSILLSLYDHKSLNPKIWNDIFDIDSHLLLKTVVPNLQQGKGIWNDELIKNVVYSPDGQSILVTTQVFENSLVRILICDINGAFKKELIPHLQQGDIIRNAVYSPNGQSILVITNRSVHIYNINGTLKQRITPDLQRGDGVKNVEYSPDGQSILVITNRRVFIYNINGTLIQQITPVLPNYDYNPEGFATFDAYSSDGQFILVTNDRRVFIYKINGELVREIIPDLQGDNFVVRGAMYGPDGQSILVKTHRSVHIYNINGTLIQQITPDLQQGDGVKNVEYSPDGQSILVKTDRRVFIYNINGTLIQRIIPDLPQNDNFLTSAHYSPDGQLLVVSAPSKILIYFINFKSLNLDQKILIVKASDEWKADKPYILNDDELEMYNSLPEVLKDKRLFTTSSGSCVIS